MMTDLQEKIMHVGAMKRAMHNNWKTKNPKRKAFYIISGNGWRFS
jgi:hypothetical protein